MTQTKKHATRRTAEQWALLMERFDQGGLSVQEFCDAEEIGHVSFYRWRKRLAKTDTRSIEPPPFVDLSLLNHASKTGPWHIVLSLGDGVELTLRRH